MEFHTKIDGIPCICCVDYYQCALPAKITGSGFGDCEPPEPEEFEFHMKDRNGRDAPWLDKKVSNRDCRRMLTLFHFYRDNPDLPRN